MKDLYHVNEAGELEHRPHPGQWKTLESAARVVLMLGGTQSGKTTLGPIWFYQEIQRCGPGDYIIATPTFKLLELKALPAFRLYFENLLCLGKYVGSPVRRFTFSGAGNRSIWPDWDGAPTNVYFGHAREPDSLESATAKAAWLDEAGQKSFKYDSYLAVRRRLSLHRGRILITTTPYNLGWLKQQVYDRFMGGDDRFEVVRFPSTLNPAFPAAEFAEAQRDLPSWKFDMYYRGIFSRPAGTIYDAFQDVHRISRFEIPADWPRYVGIDFGPVNTAAMFYAGRPDGVYVAYRQYKAVGRTASEHAEAIQRGEPPFEVVRGGAGSENQWRLEFRAAGLDVRPPLIASVEVGIDRVIAAHKHNQILAFADLDGYLDEKLSYARVLDDNSNPTEKIENKNDYHFMDAERYIISSLIDPLAGAGESRIVAAVDPLDDLGW